MTFFRVPVSAIREGPVALSVAARERLISVTVALFQVVSKLLGFPEFRNRHVGHRE